ncbi:hypothetical protein K1T71_014943 [Dendrolimus kikuchii]|nr:hypothetical protein K1T71_014943 [Dendrolimus kikuchii]
MSDYELVEAPFSDIAGSPIDMEGSSTDKRKEGGLTATSEQMMPIERIAPRATRSHIDDTQIKKSSPKDPSILSKKSMASSIAKRKQLEFEAAQAKAKIAMELIDKKLEADLAQVDADEAEDNSRCSDAPLDDVTTPLMK